MGFKQETSTNECENKGRYTRNKSEYQFTNIVTKGGYICIIGYKKTGNTTHNKIYLFNSKIEPVGQAEIDVEDQTGYHFEHLKMDIAISGQPVIIITSEGVQRNFYAFAFDNGKINMVDKIDDLHDAKILDVKYHNGHYFTYGLDGVLNRISLSKE